MSRPIRTLLMSTLFPSAARPGHGLFVETRLRELLKSGQVETRVVAPVPWFPFSCDRFGEYGAFAATPHHEIRNCIEVFHPRYLLPPRVGMNIAPDLMAVTVLKLARRLVNEGFDFDLIDAHYYYPDGVAAAKVARALGKPFVVTARGTDLNLIANFPKPRSRIVQTADSAFASIGVSRALMDRLVALGADAGKVHVMRNGVDLDQFFPESRDAARAHLGLPIDAKILLSVGRLVENKGHHISIEALSALPADVLLVIAGSGPELGRLRQLAARYGVTERVRFAGMVAQRELKWYYSAANVLALCSISEGWANVLLEAMACGTPVLATAIPGTTEVVCAPEAGALMRDRSVASFVAAYMDLTARMPTRDAVRRYAERFSWDETSAAQLVLFRSMVSGTS